MTRFVHIITLLVVAAIFVNAQCFAACLVPDSGGYATQQSTCCTEHQPPHTRPHSPCQHQYSELKNAEWPADFSSTFVALWTGGIAIPAGEWGDVPTGLLSACPLSVTTVRSTPPKNPRFLTLSILRV
ncbi:MAG TPA: hypothetical protein VLJ11_08855 [Bryobacteraceae bacterium]|nr:hypothetical protein [Bryobacteraceae bacterium]